MHKKDVVKEIKQSPYIRKFLWGVFSKMFYNSLLNDDEKIHGHVRYLHKI